jgi:hypothetical protein
MVIQLSIANRSVLNDPARLSSCMCVSLLPESCFWGIEKLDNQTSADLLNASDSRQLRRSSRKARRSCFAAAE